MADSVSEAALKALYLAVSAAAPVLATCERNSALPIDYPAAGILIVRDGEPGEPDVLMSPETYIYTHLADIDVVFQNGDAAARDAGFDILKQAVATALSTDRTLGGSVEYALGRAPAPLEITAEGVEAIKAATIQVELTYETSDPLA
jgi:hypothetical protein